MTEPDGRERPSSALVGSPVAEPPATVRLCPFLLADGGWRSASPAGEHRCTALEPPTRLAADKQRRLCLTADHTGCPTFLAASDERAARSRPGPTPAGRPIARTAPVVIERARPLLMFGASPGTRRWGELALVVLMLVALVAVVVARSGSDGAPAAGGVASPSELATPGAMAPATTRPTADASPPPSAASSGGSGVLAATATPGARPAATPPAPASPSADVGTTYTVKRGDTLSAIAIRFGTTIAAIRELNLIADPSLIRVGQTLRIP